MKMSQFDAVMIAEGAQQAESEDQFLEAWQYLADTGLAWQLQGYFGRTAEALISEGHISCPEHMRGPGIPNRGYTVESEWSGHGEPRYVARLRGKLIGSSESLFGAWREAARHHQSPAS